MSLADRILITTQLDSETINKLEAKQLKAKQDANNSDLEENLQTQIDWAEQRIELNNYQFQIPKTAQYGVYIKTASLLANSNWLDIRFNDSKTNLLYNWKYQIQKNKTLNQAYTYIGRVELEKNAFKINIKSNGKIMDEISKNLFVLESLNQKPAISQNQNFEISYSEINPVKLVVNVKNASTPYILNFLESFHPKWKVFEKKGRNNLTWFKKEISSDQHYTMNGYANAWLIDKTGDYELIIEYTQQKYIYLGVLISTCCLVFIISWFLIRIKYIKELILRIKKLI